MDAPRKPGGRGTTADEEEELRLGWQMAGLAFTTASEAAAGALLGWLVDHFAHTGPTGLLVGSIVGIAVGLLSLIRGAYRLNQRMSQQELQRPKPLPKPIPPEDDERDDDDWKD